MANQVSFYLNGNFIAIFEGFIRLNQVIAGFYNGSINPVYDISVPYASPPAERARWATAFAPVMK